MSAVWLMRGFAVISDRREKYQKGHKPSGVHTLVNCWEKKLLIVQRYCWWLFFLNLPLRCFSPLELSPEDPEMKICDQNCFAAAPGYDCMSKINWGWFLACPSKSPAAHYDTAEGRKHLPMFSWAKGTMTFFQGCIQLQRGSSLQDGRVTGSHLYSCTWTGGNNRNVITPLVFQGSWIFQLCD